MNFCVKHLFDVVNQKLYKMDKQEQNSAMEKIVQTKWNEEMSFDAEVNGHKVTLDADAAVGGGVKIAAPDRSQ